MDCFVSSFTTPYVAIATLATEKRPVKSKYNDGQNRQQQLIVRTSQVGLDSIWVKTHYSGMYPTKARLVK